ncbi:Ligand-binding SRPBCC domain-containing protein [Verrucomicrobium sp. GAS474]|uniref:SRPBCC family protein n=1 Tax=Verrucomicrobium sp. GAS474 TaxID=1882831 RepID=UPI00087DC8F2|nr:SRPBCC family protein [Verrucomicrobium sp. GAS474]SDT91501.1 Ligand-binding SRPBCC domain-containing protein [Verrucomicrobium sp. GAS474]
MPLIIVTHFIQAPPERVFDLALSVDLHAEAAYPAQATAIAGVTRGLLGPGDAVTWRARQFGLSQTLTSRITAFARPGHFRDSMVEGPFRRFDHDHFFTARDGGTVVEDRFDFTTPCGWLGSLADALFLRAHMRRLIAAQAAAVRKAAENDGGDGWRRYLGER